MKSNPIGRFFSSLFSKPDKNREPHVQETRVQEPLENSAGALDDSRCMTMIDCSLKILETIRELNPGGNSDLEDITKNCIFEHLILIGGKPIAGENEFNPSRHTPREKILIMPGSRIEIVQPGVELDGKTLIKATVKKSE